MTNKDMIKSILDDTDRLVKSLIEPACNHCIHCGYAYCNCDTVGIKKWLMGDINENE